MSVPSVRPYVGLWPPPPPRSSRWQAGRSAVRVSRQRRLPHRGPPCSCAGHTRWRRDNLGQWMKPRPRGFPPDCSAVRGRSSPRCISWPAGRRSPVRLLSSIPVSYFRELALGNLTELGLVPCRLLLIGALRVVDHALKVDQDNRLDPNDPRVMPWREHGHFARSDVHLRPVVHPDMEDT